MNDAKKARGYFQKSEPLTNDQKIEREARLKKMMATAPCRGCGQFGHWSKDLICPKHPKSSAGQPEPAYLTTVAAKDVLVSEADALTAIKSESTPGMDVLVQYAEQLRALNVPIFNLGKYKSPHPVNHTEISCSAMEVFQSHSESVMDSHVIVDLGCARSVCGPPWLKRRLGSLKKEKRF